MLLSMSGSYFMQDIINEFLPHLLVAFDSYSSQISSVKAALRKDSQ